MKGLELARRFWEELYRPAVEAQCPELLDKMAVGLCGAGSDCLGFDDEISRDHAFAAGCMVFLTAEEAERSGFRLSTVYDRLPREFLGFPCEHRSRQGGGRYGVHTVEEFFRPLTGSGGAPEDWRQWMALPCESLAEACAGEVFFDGPGIFTAERERVLHGMDENVRLKKLAARAALMAQSGQYNYPRCLRHGQPGAARLALDEFVRQGLGMLFLLNRQHMPFYKWAFRAAAGLPERPDLAARLEALLLSPSEEEVESIAAEFIAELKARELTDGDWDYLEPHAYEIMERITDPEIAAMHVMEGAV